MPKGISLHIGVNRVDKNHYAGWDGPLIACEADAEDMHALAHDRGFDARMLLTTRATRPAVTQAMSDAARTLAAGDFFFLSYSGHGGQVPDVSGDESDRQDETWCLFDGQMLDDELFTMWARFARGVRILVLSDSCHSGTVVRNAITALEGAVATAVEDSVPRPVRYRFMPEAAAFRTYRANRAFYDALGRAPSATVEMAASLRLISGCQDNQLSMDGTFNGLFTGTLLHVWDAGRFRGDYRALHRDILERMPPRQSPNYMSLGPPESAFDQQLPFTI